MDENKEIRRAYEKIGRAQQEMGELLERIVPVGKEVSWYNCAKDQQEGVNRQHGRVLGYTGYDRIKVRSLNTQKVRQLYVFWLSGER